MNQQTSNAHMLKSQLQSHAHKKPTPAHKHLQLSHSFFFLFLSLTKTHTHTEDSTSQQVQCHPGWGACTAALCPLPGSVQCWPVLHEALSACQLSQVDCTKSTHRGCLVNCTVGSSEVKDSLSSLLLSFETLQLHQGVLTLCSSIVSSGKRPSFFLYCSCSFLSLSLSSARRQSMRVTGFQQ